MNTDDLKIKMPRTLACRVYIEFYFNGKRIREYTAKSILLDIEPNRAKTIEKKIELLYQLKSSLLEHINNQNYPARKNILKPLIDYSIEVALKLALEAKLRIDLSKRYKDDLQLIHDQFMKFIDKDGVISFKSLDSNHLESFLSQFNSSGTYYMKKRNDLSILLAQASKIVGCPSIARTTHTERSKAKLHQAYEKAKMRELLKYLSTVNPHLHLCCLLTYACWLRPHVEVLSLKRFHFKNDFTEIHLSGSENKGRKNRTVYVPDYVREYLIPFTERLNDEQNIFSQTNSSLNRFYFTTMWKRLRKVLIDKKLIEHDQTIYSFRHTAAIEIYKRKKDIYLLQKLMGHSSIGVTQKYLRSLGQTDIEELISGAPSL